MNKLTKVVKWEDGKFWELCIDTTTNSEYEQEASFGDYDKLANGFLWSMSVRGHKQRKHHARSGMARSIYAMLDSVKAELQADSKAEVLCLTPDVCIEFFAG